MKQSNQTIEDTFQSFNFCEIVHKVAIDQMMGNNCIKSFPDLLERKDFEKHSSKTSNQQFLMEDKTELAVISTKSVLYLSYANWVDEQRKNL